MSLLCLRVVASNSMVRKSADQRRKLTLDEPGHNCGVTERYIVHRIVVLQLASPSTGLCLLRDSFLQIPDQLYLA